VTMSTAKDSEIMLGAIAAINNGSIANIVNFFL